MLIHMKSRDVVSKTILGWVGGGHYSTKYCKKCTYVMLNWIHFINNNCMVHFLTLIYGPMTAK